MCHLRPAAVRHIASVRQSCGRAREECLDLQIIGVVSNVAAFKPISDIGADAWRKRILNLKRIDDTGLLEKLVEKIGHYISAGACVVLRTCGGGK